MAIDQWLGEDLLTLETNSSTSVLNRALSDSGWSVVRRDCNAGSPPRDSTTWRTTCAMITGTTM